MAETATDLLLGGRLTLEQPLRGHRAGTDAIVLAAAVPGDFVGVLADAGAGVGTAGLTAGLFKPGRDLLLIEREPELAGLAMRNLAANGLKGLVVACDLLDPKSRRAAGLMEGMADLVISNPPFLDPGQGHASPDDLRARAHVLDQIGGIESWIRACVAIGSAQAEIILIHRADRLGELLAALQGRTGAISVIAIHPRIRDEASRVLIRAKKGSRAPLRLMPPLVLHEADGCFTAQAQAIHRGEATIAW
jgi:tRNA1(Val) A37 N6-methylase TrmN6